MHDIHADNFHVVRQHCPLDSLLNLQCPVLYMAKIHYSNTQRLRKRTPYTHIHTVHFKAYTVTYIFLYILLIYILGANFF